MPPSPAEQQHPDREERWVTVDLQSGFQLRYKATYSRNSPFLSTSSSTSAAPDAASAPKDEISHQIVSPASPKPMGTSPRRNKGKETASACLMDDNQNVLDIRVGDGAWLRWGKESFVKKIDVSEQNSRVEAELVDDLVAGDFDQAASPSTVAGGAGSSLTPVDANKEGWSKSSSGEDRGGAEAARGTGEMSRRGTSATAAKGRRSSVVANQVAKHFALSITG
mmetsp:Transcript_21563/g.54402  ORF Transcript_21563/g.54402 Transcript_21563/m.54402 type:complete len:223 (-) Transcript_21563:608-1276(-)